MSAGRAPLFLLGTVIVSCFKKEVASTNISTSYPYPEDVVSKTTPMGTCYLQENSETDKEEKPVLFYLFLLLLLVPVAIATYMCIKKRKKDREKDKDAELIFQRFQRKHFHTTTRKAGRKIKIEVSPPSEDEGEYHPRRHYSRRRMHTAPSGDYDLITNRDHDFHVYRVMKNAKNCHRCSEASAGSVFLNDTSMGTPTYMCPRPQRRSSQPSSTSGGHLLMVPSCGPGGSSRCASYITLQSDQPAPNPPNIEMPSHRHQTRSSCGDREYRHNGPNPGVPHLYLHKSHHSSLPHPQLLKDGFSPAQQYGDYHRYSPARPRGRPEKIAKSLPFLYDFALNGKTYVPSDSSNHKESWQSGKSHANELSNRSWFPSESDIAEYCTAHEDTLMNCTENTVFEQGPNISQGKPSGRGIHSISRTPVQSTGRPVGTPQTVKVQNFSVSRVYAADDSSDGKKALFTSMYNKKQSLLSIECDSDSVVAGQDYDSHNNSRPLDSINMSQSLLVDHGSKRPCLVADYENTTFETSVVEVVPRLSLPLQDNIGDIEAPENKMSAVLIDPNNNIEGKTGLVLQNEQSGDVFVLEEGESMV